MQDQIDNAAVFSYKIYLKQHMIHIEPNIMLISIAGTSAGLAKML